MKKITAFLLTVVIVLGIIPMGLLNSTAATASTPHGLKFGDYFVLGNYLGEEIVWRHIGDNGYGDVALSFRILTSKAYNSVGIKPANTSVPDNIQIPQEVDPNGTRAKTGANIWVNSTLRAWLNSDADEVIYIGNKPSNIKVTANPYDDEKGFLSNFTPAERSVMRATKHAAALNEVDIALRTAGSQVPGWDNGANLTDPIRHMVTDTVFLPDANLLAKIANDTRLNWRVGYWSTGFHRAGITDSALTQAKEPQTPAGEYYAVEYWTGTPVGSQWNGTSQMQIRLIGGGHSFVSVNEGVMGVRPAFYINHDAVAITGGSGTQDDPYTISSFDTSFGVTLNGNNTQKLYAPNRDILSISTPAVSGLKLYYITVNPESSIVIDNEASFNSYGPVSLNHLEGKASMPVNRNCTVWVMAKGNVNGKTKVAFASITYKNFYDRVQILQEGKIENTNTYLYHNTIIDGIYGLPLNKFEMPVSVISGADYDTVPAADALPAEIAPHWTRIGNMPAGILLNNISYYDGNPTIVTMQYKKTQGKWWTVKLEFVDMNGKPLSSNVAAAHGFQQSDPADTDMPETETDRIVTEPPTTETSDIDTIPPVTEHNIIDTEPPENESNKIDTEPPATEAAIFNTDSFADETDTTDIEPPSDNAGVPDTDITHPKQTGLNIQSGYDANDPFAPVILTDFMPAKKGKFSDFGLSYTLPTEDNLFPYAWQVEGASKVTPGESGEMSTGFDPCITDDNLTVKVFYKQDRVTVTESFVLDVTGQVLKNDIVNWVDNGGFYKKLTPPKIDHHVVVGYELSGTRVNLQYTDSDRWNSILSWIPITEALSQNLAITFYFAADVNGDEIPDKDQYRLTARWIGVYPDGKETDIKPPKYVRTRINTYNTWANIDDTANSSTQGNEKHVMDGENSKKWIFDKTRPEAPALQTVIQQNQEDVFVCFYYDQDSLNTGVADKNQGVAEKYAVYDGSTLTYPDGWENTFTNVVKGERYSKAVPAKDGYVPVGWLLDNDDFVNNNNGFGGSNSDRAIIDKTTAPNHTVTFVYRVAAAPITIRWVGTTPTGHKVAFGYITAHGYLGETLNLGNLETLRSSVEVDAEKWKWNAVKSTVISPIVFSDVEKEYFFHFDEIEEFIYNINWMSTDGKMRRESEIKSKTSDSQFAVSAINIPLYRYDRYEVWEYDRLYDSGTSNTVTLEPSKGAMTVYFYYVTAVADVTVKAIERGTGTEILTKTRTDIPIGGEYSVSAPEIAGWALAAGEPIIKKVMVEDGGSKVIFEYERPGTVFINCIEERDGKETVIRRIPVASTGAVSPPDLKGDYFIFDEANSNNSGKPYYTVTDNDFVNGKTIKYYYKSMMMDVRIVAVGEDGEALRDGANAVYHDVLHINAARVGEMYTAKAPAPPLGYILTGDSVREIYANPDYDVLDVFFVYHKLAPGEITVRHYYNNGQENVILDEYYSYKTVGETYMATSKIFPGFVLANSAEPTKSITVDIDPKKNIIEFEYNELLKRVTVQINKNGIHDVSLNQPFDVREGTVYTVFPPYIENHSLLSYKINNGEEKTAGLAAIIIGEVDSDVTVTLNYVSYVTINIIGKENDTAGNELFSFAKRIRFNSNVETIIDAATELPQFEAWKLIDGQSAKGTITPNANQSIEFFYERKLTTVTINAVLSGTGAAIQGFIPIRAEAPIGEAFIFEAPYIPGHKPATGEQTKTIPSVAANDTLTFEYEQLPTGNVHVILREDDRGGIIIGEEEYTLSYGYSLKIDVPDLSVRFYTPISEARTVTYLGEDITVEYFYEKDKVQVVKKTYDENVQGVPTTVTDMGLYRAGEIVRFYAPSKDNFRLTDESLKLVRIIPPPAPSTRLRATTYQEVQFNYTTISDRLVVEAVTESGFILLTYYIAGSDGESISVSAPDVPGYALKPGEAMSKTGVVPGKVTFTYVRSDTSAFGNLNVTVKSAHTGAALQGAEISAKSGGITVRTNYSGSDGKVALYDLPKGEYTLTAKHTDYIEKTTQVTLDGDKSIQISLLKPSLGDSGSGSGDSNGVGGSTGSNKPEAEQPPPEDEAEEKYGGMLEKAIHIKYINGYDDGTFRPDAYITRAEVASVFFRLLKEKPEPTGITFADVNGNEWYANAVNTLSGMGIVKGYDDGSFRPLNHITRAEFVAVTSRFDTIEKSSAGFFRDVDDGHWAEGYINSAYVKGWISGYPSGNFKPENPITRSEVVKIINGILDRKVKTEDIPKDAHRFADMRESHWAYADILEASTEHDYTRGEDNYEIWINYSR